MPIYSLFFYFFSIIAIFASIMVTVSKNTVHSVFFLILDFITISCLFIMLGAEFLGMIMLIVYVGAVAVLFLFVVMMLDVSLPQIKKKLSKYFSIGGIISLVIFFELLILLTGTKFEDDLFSKSYKSISKDFSNTESLGNILYTDYIYLFQLAGMILLVSMVGAIVLTFRKRTNVKKQNVFKQISRESETSVTLVDVESGKGVKLNV